MKTTLQCIALTVLFFHTPGLTQQQPTLLKEVLYRIEDAEWKLTAVDTYLYTSKKILKEKVSYILEGDRRRNHRKIAYANPRPKNGVSTRIEMAHDGIGAGWSHPYRSIFYTDANGIDTAVEHQVLDTVTREFMTTQKGMYAFDGKNRLTSITYFIIKDGQWVGQERTTFDYAGNGRVREELVEVSKGGRWVLQKRISLTYDENKNVALREIYHVDGQTGKMEKMADTRHVFAYDANGNLLAMIIRERKGNVWMDQYKRVSYYQSTSSS